MPRAWVHPMKHLVRVVNTDGSSTIKPMAWQQPGPSLKITTLFLSEDHLTNEAYTGAPSKAKPKVGRRARFENRFAFNKTQAPTSKGDGPK